MIQVFLDLLQDSFHFNSHDLDSGTQLFILDLQLAHFLLAYWLCGLDHLLQGTLLLFNLLVLLG